jgi:hypothetical protein
MAVSNIVSNCCGAIALGGGDELYGTGRCSDCHEGCLFIPEEEKEFNDFDRSIQKKLKDFKEQTNADTTT